MGLAESGQTAAARSLYDRLQRAYPDDFTFPLAHAGLLDRQGEPTTALTYAKAALARSYGDNRLRAAERVAKLLHKLSRDTESREVIDDALGRARVPADPNNRTHRYVKALRTLRESLGQRRAGR